MLWSPETLLFGTNTVTNWLTFHCRVFADRLVDFSDSEAFVNLMSDKLGTMFDLTYHNLCPNKQPPIFGK